jgi:hypothetical protein
VHTARAAVTYLHGVETASGARSAACVDLILCAHPTASLLTKCLCVREVALDAVVTERGGVGAQTSDPTSCTGTLPASLKLVGAASDIGMSRGWEALGLTVAIPLDSQHLRREFRLPEQTAPPLGRPKASRR